MEESHEFFVKEWNVTVRFKRLFFDCVPKFKRFMILKEIGANDYMDMILDGKLNNFFHHPVKPAVEFTSGENQYWLNGIRISEQEEEKLKQSAEFNKQFEKIMGD